MKKKYAIGVLLVMILTYWGWYRYEEQQENRFQILALKSLIQDIKPSLPIFNYSNIEEESKKVQDSLIGLLQRHKSLSQEESNRHILQINTAEKLFKEQRDSTAFYYLCYRLAKSMEYHNHVQNTFNMICCDHGFDIVYDKDRYGLDDTVSILIKPRFVDRLYSSYVPAEMEIKTPNKTNNVLKIEAIGTYVLISFNLKQMKAMEIQGTISYTNVSYPEIKTKPIAFECIFDPQKM